MGFLWLCNDQGASFVKEATNLSFFLVFKNFLIGNLFGSAIVELYPSILQRIHFYTYFIMSRFSSWSTMDHDSPYVVGFGTGLFSLFYSFLLKVIDFFQALRNLFVYSHNLGAEVVFGWVFSLLPQRIRNIWNIYARKFIFFKVSKGFWQQLFLLFDQVRPVTQF